MALIGSTALRIDTPDSDLDVVVYTCTLADLRWQKLLGGEPRAMLGFQDDEFGEHLFFSFYICLG